MMHHRLPKGPRRKGAASRAASRRSGRRPAGRFERLECRELLAADVLYRVNAGGEELAGDPTWSADTDAVSSPFNNFDAATAKSKANSVSTTVDASGVPGVPAALFQTERFDKPNQPNLEWDFPVTPGDYEVRLYFAETFAGGFQTGFREFDVEIEGVKVLDNYDVFAEAGALTGVVKSFTVSSDANLDIDFGRNPGKNNPNVKGIEIIDLNADAPAGSVWSEVAPSPIAVFEGQGAAVGDEHYLLGGFIEFLAVSSESYSYNPATDTWTELAPFPDITEEIVTLEGVATGEFVTGGLTHGSTAVDGDKLYVVGGFVGDSPGQATAVVSVYDTVTDTWTRTTSLPAPRGGGGVAVVGRQLHYFGGGTRTFDNNAINDQPDHWVLDLGATDSPLDDAAQWTPLADVPNPRNHTAGAVIDGVIYAVGGQLKQFEAFQNQQVLEAYDPATDTWTRLADIPIPLGHLMASVVVSDGKLITIGGVTNNDNPAGQDGTRRTATVFAYDPVTDQWATLESLPDERQSPTVGLVDGQIIVASGASADGREFSTLVADAAQLLASAGSNLVVTQSSLDLGAVTVGETAEQQVTLTNTGLAGGDAITIDPAAATFVGSGAAFGFSLGGGSPVVLAPGASTTATISYTPAAAAADAATLSIPHDGVNRTIDIALTGSGVQAPGGGGGQIVYRVNAGGAEIAGDPTWVGDFDSNASPFSNYDPGSSTSKSKTWAPPVDGSALPDVPTEVFQTERFDKANQPNLEWDFPVTPGDYEVRLYFAENWTGAFSTGVREFDVQIEGATVLDNFDVFASFGAQTGGVQSFTVSSDANLDIDFLRIPGKNNPNVKAIEIVAADATGGGPSQLSISAGSLDFGSVDVGASAQLSLSLTNGGQAGDDPITVDPASVSLSPGAGPFSFEFVAATPITLAPGQSTAVTVTYSPSAAGDDAATLAIPHDGTNAPVEIALVGQGADAGPQPVSFSKAVLGGVADALERPTSVQFGPDGRLYVSQQNGLLRVYTIDETDGQYVATSEEVITLIADIPNHDDDGVLNPAVTGRLVTGLLVTGTAANPVVYVTSGDPRIGGGPTGVDLNLDTNSGILTRLTWNGSSWDQLDLVRGLPRSDENHTANGMALDEATGTLYIAVGGNTNAGAPSNNFAFLPEYALSAAILSVDLNAIGESTYDIPTLDDEDQPGPDATDPFGGNNGKNQAIIVPGGPVQVYAPGFRNPYDVVLTSSGRLYSVDNGPNADWGDVPIGEGPEGNATNDVNEPGLTYGDGLHFVDGPGYYGGHPNPTRSNPANTFNDTNPQSPVPGPNPIESDFQIPGVEDGSLIVYPNSTNGIAEYTASEFGGALQGDLIIASFDNSIKRVKLNAAGDQIVEADTLFSNVGFRPLDVTAPATGDFAGSIWVVDVALGTVIVFTPDTGGGGVAGDADGDGYSDDDETANGTDPNSAADFPSDNDGDFLSDLLDNDDDNDGLLDTSDPFAIDPDNGATTPVGVAYEWENEGENLGGLLGLGFTGLMTGGGADYTDLFDDQAVTAGGAAGVFTIDNASAGTALGSANDQEQAFQIGFNAATAAGAFAAETAVLGAFNGVAPQAGQQMGLFLGLGDQDNFVQVVVSGDGGGAIQAFAEFGGVTTQLGSTPLPLPGESIISLRLTADPAASTLQASYALDGVNYINVGAAVAIPPAIFSTTLAAGLISTNPTASQLPVTWDYLRVVPAGVQASTASLLVAAPPLLPGDYDGSGSVDDADREVWAATYGSDADLRADGNGNGYVDIADYSIWRANAGAVSPLLTMAPAPVADALVADVAAPALLRVTEAAVGSANGVGPADATAYDAALAADAAAASDDLLLLTEAIPAVADDAVDEAFVAGDGEEAVGPAASPTDPFASVL